MIEWLQMLSYRLRVRRMSKQEVRNEALRVVGEVKKILAEMPADKRVHSAYESVEQVENSFRKEM